MWEKQFIWKLLFVIAFVNSANILTNQLISKCKVFARIQKNWIIDTYLPTYFYLLHDFSCILSLYFTNKKNWNVKNIFGQCINIFYLKRDADVALVTPMRDGMNLVAKEFVACRTKNPGVLILSPFAGAGETMQEALSVNPYEISNMASVLHR